MQTVERPRFRQDLVAEAIEEGGQKFIDVGDPDSGHMFRFYESEFSIACGMDGERDVAGIVAWAKDELGLMATSKEVRSVIAQLAELSFLDQAPAARAAASERPAVSTELAAGVVVGQQQKRAPAGVDVELGSAGAKAASAQPLPKTGDIELGTPGVGAAATKAPRPPVEDVKLGAPGARAPATAKSDVSLDLADHMGVKPDDVKEAVRQSRQMSAVEAPKDLLEQAAAPVPAPKVAPAAQKSEPKPAAATVSEKKPEAKPAEAKPAAVTAPVAAEKKPEKKPEAKPAEKKPAETKPVVVAEKKPIPEAPRQGISPVLIILLVLAIGGAGAYFAWKYLISKKAETTSEVQPPPVTPGSQVAPEPPPPPPAPKGKIEIASGADRDILSVFPGNVESIDTTEREVDTSDVIARLVGAKRLEAEIASLDREIERRKATLTAA